MHWFTGFMLYVIIWWLVLFAVLPFWTRPIAEAERIPGGFRGVPARPLIWRKILVTTGVATLIWVASVAVIRSDLISFRNGALTIQDR